VGPWEPEIARLQKELADAEALANGGAKEQNDALQLARAELGAERAESSRLNLSVQALEEDVVRLTKELAGSAEDLAALRAGSAAEAAALGAKLQEADAAARSLEAGPCSLGPYTSSLTVPGTPVHNEQTVRLC